MDPSISLQITAWFWITMGAAGVIGAVIRTFTAAVESEQNWWEIPVFLGIAYAGNGLSTLGVAAAGWPSIALYVWRATAIICVLIGSIIFTRIIIAKRGRHRGSAEGRDGSPGFEPEGSRFSYGPLLWSTTISTGILAAMAWLSFRSNPPEISSDALSSAAPVAATSVLPAASILWLATLVVLGLGTIYFLYLFVQRLEEGGAPQIEAHWGGIGGGLGGWRMSPALGHVLVATLLAILFTVFLFRLDSRERHSTVTVSSHTPT